MKFLTRWLGLERPGARVGLRPHRDVELPLDFAAAYARCRAAIDAVLGATVFVDDEKTGFIEAGFGLVKQRAPALYAFADRRRSHGNSDRSVLSGGRRRAGNVAERRRFGRRARASATLNRLDLRHHAAVLVVEDVAVEEERSADIPLAKVRDQDDRNRGLNDPFGRRVPCGTTTVSRQSGCATGTPSTVST